MDSGLQRTDERIATRSDSIMLEPRKRTALDGKVWWCVFDTNKNDWCTLICFGKYKTRRECQIQIDWYKVDR